MGVVLICGLSLFGGVAMAATIGTSGDDAIKGTKASEKIKARGGNDVVRARRGNDTVYGNRGNDRLFGQTGNDRLIGGEGSDKLVGDDVIIANDGERDKIICGYGNDFVYADPSDIIYYGCEKVRIDR